MTAISVKTETVQAAQEGDRIALERVLEGVQDQIHHLARRILVNPEDAREATQEILILILTKLSTFKGESRFSTWVYRVAVRYLVSAKKVRDRDLGLTFDAFAADLEDGLVSEPPKAPDDVLLLNELRISCTMAMLLCLTMDLRLAYVLGDILELEHGEASSILEIAPAAYRKRLSRAREEVMRLPRATAASFRQRRNAIVRSGFLQPSLPAEFTRILSQFRRGGANLSRRPAAGRIGDRRSEGL